MKIKKIPFSLSWILFLIGPLIFYTDELFGLKIDQVVIWGHKLHSHTHSYIHERFFRAFEYLGYRTYWFDDKDDVSNFNFANSLFITEGQVDGKIPIRFDCRYILHNCSAEKYLLLNEASRCIFMQTYTDDLLSLPHLVQVEPFIYYDILGKGVYFPWASDFLPNEIEYYKNELLNQKIKREPTIYWIGTIGSSSSIFGNENQIGAFERASLENGISFKYFNPWVKGIDREISSELYRRGYFAPAIVGPWQERQGYIPCRIFISIGCGQMGITNSYRTYELFDKKIVFNPDCYQLFYDAEERKKSWTIQEQIELMDFVKEKHTYVSRVKTLLDFISLCENSE